MKTGTKVYFKPIRFFTVLFEHEDGRLQIQEDKGGMSMAVDPKDLSMAPTLIDENEQLYWEHEALKMKKYLSERE